MNVLWCWRVPGLIMKELWHDIVFWFVQGVGGAVQYPKNYLKEAYKLVRERGGVCIADEVRVTDYEWKPKCFHYKNLVHFLQILPSYADFCFSRWVSFLLADFKQHKLGSVLHPSGPDWIWPNRNPLLGLPRSRCHSRYGHNGEGHRQRIPNGSCCYNTRWANPIRSSFGWI